MALILLGTTTCSICGKILKEPDQVLGWQAFLPKEHPLWPYSDSGMHKACFANWEHKAGFEHLHRYQPTLDFEHPETKALIQQYGIPEWMQEVKAYRESLDPLPDK